jgi:hypothetical protein
LADMVVILKPGRSTNPVSRDSVSLFEERSSLGMTCCSSLSHVSVFLIYL